MIMVDIETLSTRRDAAIIQIGACAFDGKEIRKTFLINVSGRDCIQNYDMHHSQETIDWWKQRPKEVQQSVFSNPQDLNVAVERFTKFFLENSTTGIIWCNGASFDFPILYNAYDVIGIDLPWKFWNERDARTMFKVFNVEYKRPANAHNALADVEACTKALQVILNVIKEG